MDVNVLPSINIGSFLSFPFLLPVICARSTASEPRFVFMCF